MSMTQEQALKLLEHPIYKWSMDWDEREDGLNYTEAIEIAISALRPVRRERVKKVWRGEWIGMTDDDGYTWYECSQCEHDLDSLEVPNHFCPACGAPMTDEAVQIVLERLEALNDV